MSEKTQSPMSRGQAAGSAFKPGDIAWRKSWNYPRVLIVSVGVDRIARCINEFDENEAYPVALLETQDEWVCGCRATAEDCTLTGAEVRRYIEAGTSEFQGGSRWRAALKDIENAAAQPGATTPP